MSERRLGTPRESWLRSDDPDKFAAAMARCECPEPGYCIDSGHCRYKDTFGNGCFSTPKKTLEERVDDLERRVKELSDRLAGDRP